MAPGLVQVWKGHSLKLLAWMWHWGWGRKMQPSGLNAVLCQDMGMDYGGTTRYDVHPSFVSLLLPTLFACPALSQLSEDSATMCRVMI